MSKAGVAFFPIPGGWNFPDLPDARCNSGQIYPDDFFAEDMKQIRIRKRAKAFCGPCPVRTECLIWALENHEKYGIWGGLDSRERRKLLKESGR